MKRIFKEKTPIRVYLAPGGCSGPRLALALDEPGEDDETSEDNGLTLCINKELAEKVGAVTVGMTHMGFVVESEIPLPSGGKGGGGVARPAAAARAAAIRFEPRDGS